MADEPSGEWWWGYACKGCGAPLAVEKTSSTGKRTSARSLASWRIQCACGHATVYGPSDRTIKILKVG